MSYVNGLKVLAKDPKLIGKLCDLIGAMPNIYFPTMGGKVFWDTLAESNGWRLQKNKFTDHCRILDPTDIRKAWGSEKVMMKALDNLAESSSKKAGSEGTSTSRMVFCPSCGEKVPDGRFCKECGSSME